MSKLLQLYVEICFNCCWMFLLNHSLSFRSFVVLCVNRNSLMNSISDSKIFLLVKLPVLRRVINQYAIDSRECGFRFHFRFKLIPATSLLYFFSDKKKKIKNKIKLTIVILSYTTYTTCVHAKLIMQSICAAS